MGIDLVNPLISLISGQKRIADHINEIKESF